VARTRSPNREEARKSWLDSGGKISTKELAAAAGVPESRIRKWKSEDKWQEELDRKKPGGQPGNKNAAGHGAPQHNTNAETHGAYSTVRLDNLSDEERAYIEGVTLETCGNMLRELQLLVAKECDLRRKIRALEDASTDTLYVDRVVEMLTPKGGTDDGDKGLVTAMQTIVKASPFDRAMKLEAELNKTHGRIIKLLDSIKSYEIDCQRIDLERRKYRLMKQKISGEFEINDETGEIDDENDLDDEMND
jgi:hypothetical protein